MNFGAQELCLRHYEHSASLEAYVITPLFLAQLKLTCSFYDCASKTLNSMHLDLIQKCQRGTLFQGHLVFLLSEQVSTYQKNENYVQRAHFQSDIIAFSPDGFGFRVRSKAPLPQNLCASFWTVLNSIDSCLILLGHSSYLSILAISDYHPCGLLTSDVIDTCYEDYNRIKRLVKSCPSKVRKNKHLMVTAAHFSSLTILN